MAGQVRADCAANLMKRSYLYTASFARPVRAVRDPANPNDPVLEPGDGDRYRDRDRAVIINKDRDHDGDRDRPFIIDRDRDHGGDRDRDGRAVVIDRTDRVICTPPFGEAALDSVSSCRLFVGSYIPRHLRSPCG